jgi:hypothetical protein
LAEIAGVADYLFQNREALQFNLEKLRDATARNLYLQTAQPIIWKHFNIDSVVLVFINVIQQAFAFQARHEVSAILNKLAPFHRRMVLRKKIAYIKSVMGL